MVHLKTWEEIQAMMEGGKILRRVVNELMPWIQPGMTTKQVDDKAEELILRYGGQPSFKKVPGYKWTTCVPVNEQIVHTPPSSYKLKEGDMLTVDIGVFYKGLHTDYADTILIGNVKDAEKEKFLKVGQVALKKALEKAVVGNHIGDISLAIENEIYDNGYFILHELTGHGVGKQLHEAPSVPGYLDRPVEKTYKIQSGLVIAVEVIYSMGTEAIAHENGEEWSIITADRSLSACFEKTIAFFEKKAFILT